MSRGDRRVGADARDGGGGLFDVARLCLCHGRDIGRVRSVSLRFAADRSASVSEDEDRGRQWRRLRQPALAPKA